MPRTVNKVSHLLAKLSVHDSNFYSYVKHYVKHSYVRFMMDK